MNIKLRLWNVILLICLATTYVVAAPAQTPAASPTPMPPPAVIQPKVIDDASAPAGWKRYQFGEQPFFSVVMPVAPTPTAERAEPSATAIVYTYVASTDSAFYAASRLDGIGMSIEKSSDAQRESFFKDYVEGFAKGFQAALKEQNVTFELKLLEPKKIRVAGREAFQQDMTVGPLTGSAQLVFAGTAAFCVITMWKSAATGADHDAFFNSFQLTGTPK